MIHKQFHIKSRFSMLFSMFLVKNVNKNKWSSNRQKFKNAQLQSQNPGSYRKKCINEAIYNITSPRDCYIYLLQFCLPPTPHYTVKLCHHHLGHNVFFDLEIYETSTIKHCMKALIRFIKRLLTPLQIPPRRKTKKPILGTLKTWGN